MTAPVPTPPGATSAPAGARLAPGALRDRFTLPDGIIYLDGNSLGALPAHVPGHLAQVIGQQWGQDLIRSWTAHGWIDLHARVATRIGRLIGAAPGTVTACDSTSVNLFKVLACALPLRPGRRVILSDSGNFPTDLYVADGLAQLARSGHTLRLVAPEDLAAAIDDTVAVVMATEVDYRSGRRHDLARLSAHARAAGALSVWDLAHSAGVLPVELAAIGADFAVGCGYKYLNGGPGAPAFLYVAPAHLEHVQPGLAGWFGHAAPFAFETSFRPAPGIERMRVGTTPVLSMAALEAALELFDGLDMVAVHGAAVTLTQAFMAAVEREAPGVEIVTPRDPAHRGAHVSLRHPQGYAVMQALIAAGVIGDFRAPDLMRFGFAPLYTTVAEVEEAAARLGQILASGRWDQPQFHRRAAVT